MNKMRVWHNSNFGNAPFLKDVDSLEEGKNILLVLAKYDLYLKDLITDNASGLEIYNKDSNKWEEWEDEETGEDIWSLINF